MTSGVMYEKNVSAKIAGRMGKAGSGSHTTFYILVFGLLKLSKNCLNP